jgi:hypothetical protein
MALRLASNCVRTAPPLSASPPKKPGGEVTRVERLSELSMGEVSNRDDG